MSNKPSKDRLYELYWGAHLNLSEMAEQFPVGRDAVRRWLRIEGIQRAPNSNHTAYVFAQLSRKRLYELYWGDALSHREIAERYNVSRRHVSTTLRRKEIPQEPHRPSTFSGASIPQKYAWPADHPRANQTHPQDESLPDDPDGDKYLAGDSLAANKDRLYELYWGYGCALEHIAEMSDVHADTIRRWMERFGIPRRRWIDHTGWEPHHGVPPKYEWPPEKEWSEQEAQAASDYNGAQWRSPDTDAAIGANAVKTPAKRSGD